MFDILAKLLPWIVVPYTPRVRFLNVLNAESLSLMLGSVVSGPLSPACCLTTARNATIDLPPALVPPTCLVTRNPSFVRLVLFSYIHWFVPIQIVSWYCVWCCFLLSWSQMLNGLYIDFRLLLPERRPTKWASCSENPSVNYIRCSFKELFLCAKKNSAHRRTVPAAC